MDCTLPIPPSRLFFPHRLTKRGLAISWTIWTLVEPANYIIAACLPTLRPILTRILPPSFFFLTRKRKSTAYSSIKICWLKGRATPRITLVSSDICGISRMTGPWDLSRAPSEDLEAAATTHVGKVPIKSPASAVKEFDVASELEM